MPSDYQREKGERFHSKGLRTGSPPDALEPGEYPYLQNVRGPTDTELTTRAGHVNEFSTVFSPVKNVSSYTSGPTTRLLAAVSSYVFLDNGALVDTGYGMNIPSMLPFRPNASPQSWMYISDGTQYRKLSAPSITNVVTAQNVGILEPQAAPGLVLQESPAQAIYALDASGNWSNTGTCGAVSNGTRSTDTIRAILRDPLSFVGSGTGTVTLQVGPTIIYQRDEFLNWTDSGSGLTVGTRINDVFTPLPTGIKIDSIQYFFGTTGLCVVVPDLLADGPGQGFSILTKAVISSLRRGALVTIGTEVCYVEDVEMSPFGGVSFTTRTTNNHTNAELLGGVPGIQLFRQASVELLIVGQTISSYQWQFAVTAGIGSVQENTANGLFFSFGNQRPFQPDDYFNFGLFLDHPENLTEMKVIINVTAGGVNYAADTYFYAVRQSDIQAGLQNTLTQLGVAQIYSQRELIDEEAAAGYAPAAASSAQAVPGASQWSQISFRLQDFVRTGNNQAQTLSNMLGIQFLFNASGSFNAAISSIVVRGQFQLDVGTAGMPYKYRMRGRSSLTGAKSNPSPPTRYGWSPRRQATLVFPPTVPDPQMDLWDIFRIGGTLNSYRLAGTIDLNTSFFNDDYSDTAIAEAEELDFDNLQPWPTLDMPLSVASATIVGYLVTFTLASTDPHVNTITRYLPGNLVRLNETVYSLWTRPILSGLTVTFQLNENAGSGTSTLFIYEPLMASQSLPFIWGPDAFGTVFGCGDTNRPGNVSYAKSYNPDSAPDKYNTEVVQPGEALTGGCLHNEESLTCTATRFWALRASFGGPTRYTPREIPTGFGAVSHFAICSDRERFYAVAKDGIYASSGGPGTLLTTRDKVYSLFPHEGVPGQTWSYANFIAYPPDYTRTAQFRLAYGNGFLYFDYPDTNGGISHLVYDIKHAAWYIDVFPVGTLPSGSITAVTASATSPILVNATDACTAVVTGTGAFNHSVLWTVVNGGGTIDPVVGTYTAPSTATTVVIQATSVQDPTKFGRVSISVSAGLITSVSVSPPTATVIENNSLQLTATVTGTGTFSTAVIWTIAGGPSGGAVSSTGLFTAPGTTGTSIVEATSVQDPTKNGHATLTITTTAATLVSIAVTPANPTIVIPNTLQMTATGTYSDSSTANISGSVTWSTMFSGIVSVDSNGVATGQGAGSDTITATLGGVHGSTGVIVQAPHDFLSYITVTPVGPTIASGTQAFTATGTYHLGETQNLTTLANWTSDNTGVATVVATTGVATAVSNGVANISATYQSVTGSTALTVSGSTTPTWRPTTYSDNGGIPAQNPWLAFDANTNTAAVISASVNNNNNLGGDVVYSAFAPSHVLSGSEHLFVVYDYARGGNGHLQVKVNSTIALTVTTTTPKTTLSFSLAAFAGANVNTLSVEVIVICLGTAGNFGNSSDIYEIYIQ